MKHVLSILLLLTVLPAFAQKATVERVVSDPLNIAASKYPMTDLNGHTAPLVIVEVLTDNVEFKGNVLDGGVVRRTGEYWVYMGVGTKILRIQSDKFLPVDIRFPDYGIPRLEPASTYVVTLALPGSVAQSAGGGSLLVVNVKPAGAKIAIDGVAYGVTPNAIEGLAVGKHDVRVSHAGYVAAKFTTSINESDISTVEGSLERLIEPPVVVPTIAAPASNPAEFSATPVHLALCATGPDGRAVYIYADQWQALSDSARSSYKPLGICLADGDAPLLVELHDKENGKEMKWDKAMQYNLPTYLQGFDFVRDVEALNNALKMFGGTIMVDEYWTKTEYNPTDARVICMGNGEIYLCEKTQKFKARAIASLPGTMTTGEFSTTPAHLALCATGLDGRTVYITADQWQMLPESVRASYKPLGVCIADTDNPFLVELHDKDAAKGMKWGKAMKFNLPTTGQGETILNNVENLNDALRVFGGTIMDNVYWTKEEKGTGAAWDILVNSGHLGFHSKTSAIGVRPVAPCPR